MASRPAQEVIRRHDGHQDPLLLSATPRPLAGRAGPRRPLLYRRLEARLDLSFVRELVTPLYAKGGRLSVDPVVFFKLQLVMFLEGLRSESQLMRAVSDRLSVRWYLGYDLFEPLADHSSLTRIRERFGLEVFRSFFEKIVEECADAGLVWGQELFLDATKVEANASIDSRRSRSLLGSRLQEHLTATFPAERPSPSRRKKTSRESSLMSWARRATKGWRSRERTR